ncbi:MUM1 protein, partial [Jacana jacana]|nr:MUM1 protein [Jacana jacana]
MTDEEYVLCTWKKRLWPAKVLCKTGVGGKASVKKAKKTSFKVEILGLKKQISVSRAAAVPLKEERIEDITSSLEQRDDPQEAVEELNYRYSLKIALDILNQNLSPREAPPPEGPKAQFSQDSHDGGLTSSPLRRRRLPCPSKEKLVPGTSKRKRGQKKNSRLKADAKPQTQDGSFRLEEGAEARERGTNPSTRDSGGPCLKSSSDNQNCSPPEPKPLLRRKKIKPLLLTDSQVGNKDSFQGKEEKKEQGRKRRRGVGSPPSRRNHLPGGETQPWAEEGSLPPVPCEAGTEVPLKRATTRSQPRRTLRGSSCKSASLEKSSSSESESLAKQLGGRKQPGRLKRVSGDQETPSSSSSSRKKKCRRLESSDLSPKIAYPECLSRLSALVDEEEEDEELPSILSHQEPQSIEEGMLVWCKLRRYPYWPAVVKNVKRKLRKACVLFIDGSTSDKKKGFSVSLKSLKHFDCEEKQDLIERAKEDYRQEIEWCIRLISDYRIRVGCRSFTGSFLEYFAADISYPVRKEGYQGLVPMAFPITAEESVGESSPETSPQKPSKKLLPDRTRAARDKANKKIVEFIVKTKGAEEHLLAILKSRKQSRWLKEFLNSSQYVTCVETYLEDEEQLDLVVNYLKEVYREMGAKNLQQLNGDAIKFISDVLLPEAIIYAISAVDDIDYKKAEEKYIKGPSVSKREREIFDEEILGRKKGTPPLASADS